VGSLEDLIALELTGPEYLSLLAEALSDGGDSSAASTLQSLAGAVDAGLTVTVGDILDVAAEANDAALDAQLNAFDMLMAGAQVARGDSAILIDPLAVSIPGVVPNGVAMRLRVVQAPQIDIGPPGKDADGEWITSVRTGQVRMAITLKLGNLPLLLGGQQVKVDLFVEAAQTEAHLDAIDCADASDPVHRVVVGAEPGLVRLGIGKYPDFTNSPDPVATDLVKVNLPVWGTVATITGFADMPFQSSGEELRFDGPFVDAIPEPSEDNTQTVGTPVGNALSTALSTMLSETQLTVVPKPPAPPLTITQKNSALAAVVNMLGPVLNELDGPLGSIFDALGLSLGGADITIFRLDTDQPALAR